MKEESGADTLLRGVTFVAGECREKKDTQPLRNIAIRIAKMQGISTMMVLESGISPW